MYRYKILDNKLITRSTRLITLENSNLAKPFSFQPGQYACIGFYKRGRPTPARCFSIVNSPTDRTILQFSMRTGGRFTTALDYLEVGDDVNVNGPFGSFVLRPRDSQKIILIAGGIGITPFMSMIRYANRLKIQNDITLIYSLRCDDDVPFAAELIEAKKQNPHLKVIFIFGNITSPKFKNQNYIKGRFSAELLNKLSSSHLQDEYFICGPPGFMKKVSSQLYDVGVPLDNINIEAFSQGSRQKSGALSIWPKNVYYLAALSVIIIAFLVMVNDLIKTNSKIQASQTNTINSSSTATNSRQSQVNQNINNLQSGNAQTTTTTTSTPVTRLS